MPCTVSDFNELHYLRPTKWESKGKHVPIEVPDGSLTKSSSIPSTQQDFYFQQSSPARMIGEHQRAMIAALMIQIAGRSVVSTSVRFLRIILKIIVQLLRIHAIQNVKIAISLTYVLGYVISVSPTYPIVQSGMRTLLTTFGQFQLMSCPVS